MPSLDPSLVAEPAQRDEPDGARGRRGACGCHAPITTSRSSIGWPACSMPRTATSSPSWRMRGLMPHARWTLATGRSTGCRPAMARRLHWRPDLVSLAREAWLLASIEHGMSRMRSGHLLWALLADDALGQRAAAVTRLLRPIPLEAFKADYAGLTAASKEIGATPERQGDGLVAPDGEPIAQRRRTRPFHHRPHRAGASGQDRSHPRT